MERATVETVIKEKIKPALESHGGNIELVDIKDNKIFVRLTGACGCCPHSQMTLKMGVEQVLKEEFSDLEEVVSVD